MRRFEFGVALGLVLLLLGGVAMAGAELCSDDCPGDGADGSCALEFCCSCCVHSRFEPTGASGGLQQELTTESPLGALDRAVPWPEPRDILHVPKTSLL